VAVQQILSSLSSDKPDDFFAELFAGIYDLGDLRSILSHLQRRGYVENEEGTWRATEKAKEFGPKLFSNIPGYESIRVIDQRTGEAIGNIELPIDNIFVLEGQAWLVRERTAETVLVNPVDSGTEIPNFASYDRFGAFFDLLPQEIRIRCRQEGRHLAAEPDPSEEILLSAA
jgi:Lhr-like helicase